MQTVAAREPLSRSLAPSLLSPDERTTLLWVCGALFPRLDPVGGDDSELFTADAISLGVPAAIEEAHAAVPTEQVQDFRLLLRALDHPLFMLGLAGKSKSFRSLRTEDRERVLLSMATSSVPPARKGFKAVKRLASLRAHRDFLFVDWRGVGGSAPLTCTELQGVQAIQGFLDEFRRRGMRPEVSCALGKIICMSSVHQDIPWAGHVNYAASKGGIHMLMRSLAQEVAAERIRGNAIAPGAIRTPINRQAWETSDALERLLTLIPYGRIGEPEDVGRAAAWLACDASDYVVGTTLYVDGGMTLYPGFATNG